jgi:hypothetical protein
MSVDINWSMLTDSSANFGNHLVNAAGQYSQRREQSRDRSALRNYLQNPNDQEALGALAERNPEAAIRLRDHHIERARQLRTDQREQLLFGARLLEGVTDEPGYQRARALAQRAGIDLSNIPETFDPGFVSQMQELTRRLNPVDPVRVGEGDQLVDPRTGRVIASGRPRVRYHAIPPGGRLEPEPGAVQPVRVTSPEQAREYPPGTPIILPDGTIGTVPGGPTPPASAGFPW